MAGLTLDTGALIAFERATERVRRLLDQATRDERRIVIPAVSIAEVWRGDARDAPVARLLKFCDVEVLDERRARDAGALRRRTPGAGAVDCCIAVGVLERGDVLATSDPDDMRALLGPHARLLVV